MRLYGIELEVMRKSGAVLSINDLRTTLAGILADAMAAIAERTPDTADEILNFFSGDMSVIACNYSDRNGKRTWIVKPDSSCWGEIASPPMPLYLLFAILKRMDLSRLESAGFVVSARTGFHVHVSDSEWDANRILELALLSIRYSDVVKAIIPQHRRDNSYCPFIPQDVAVGWVANIHRARYLLIPGQSAKSAAESITSSLSSTYSRGAISFLPLSNGRQTIEFRCAAATFKLDLILGWLSTVDRFVDLRCPDGLWLPRATGQTEAFLVRDRFVRQLGPFALSRYREFNTLSTRADRIRAQYESRIRGLAGNDLDLGTYGVRELVS
jgi:hypothetical protein